MKIEVDGALDIQKALSELGDPRAVRTSLRAILRKAARPMLEAAQAHVPIDQGDLRRSLKIAAAKGEKAGGDAFGIVIGIDANEQPAQYIIRKTNSGGRRKGAGKGGYYRDPNVAGHGPMIEFGTPQKAANPFMRPAFDAEGEATIRRFGEEAGPIIEKTAARLAKKRSKG